MLTVENLLETANDPLHQHLLAFTSSEDLGRAEWGPFVTKILLHLECQLDWLVVNLVLVNALQMPGSFSGNSRATTGPTTWTILPLLAFIPDFFFFVSIVVELPRRQSQGFR